MYFTYMGVLFAWMPKYHKRTLDPITDGCKPLGGS